MNDDPPRLSDPRMIPPSHPMSWFEPPSGADSARVWSEPEPVDDAFIRPFIVTQGRTRPTHEALPIESIVHATPAALSAPVRFEQRHIVELAQVPLALAELAAALSVPVGVVRVLVADLYASNLVLLRQPAALPVHVIERIRDLVRAL